MSDDFVAERTRSLPSHIPNRIRALRTHRGYPVPWFVADVDRVPDFRILKPNAAVIAVKENRCWVCGVTLGRHHAYLVGPMCTINRTSAEPPSHAACAQWSAKACPFLSRPGARRRPVKAEIGAVDPPGIMSTANPGVMAIWHVTAEPIPRRAGEGILFTLPDPPEHVEWMTEGRAATQSEVIKAIGQGSLRLRELAKANGNPELSPEETKWLEDQTVIALGRVPGGDVLLPEGVTHA